MKLSPEWFLEGTLDFEYKKYVLLAYLQHVSQEFAEMHLYPSFSDLIFHYNNLSTFRESKKKLHDQFPTRLSKEAFKKMELSYEPVVEEGDKLEELDQIVSYSIPALVSHLKTGKHIYEDINDCLNLEPVGIEPLYKKEGYVLLRINKISDVKAYEYKIVFFENVEANYHGISFQYLDTFTMSLSMTYENIKRELVKNHKKYSNPATFLLYSGRPFPEESALLPVAKRKMLSYLK